MSNNLPPNNRVLLEKRRHLCLPCFFANPTSNKIPGLRERNLQVRNWEESVIVLLVKSGLLKSPATKAHRNSLAQTASKAEASVLPNRSLVSFVTPLRILLILILSPSSSSLFQLLPASCVVLYLYYSCSSASAAFSVLAVASFYSGCSNNHDY